MSSVQSVTGPVEAGDLGRTLAHEHLLIDLWPWFDAPPSGDGAEAAEARAIAEAKVGPAIAEAVRANPFAIRDNLVLDDLDLAASELGRFAAAGGRTVVDLTLPEIGRNPGKLRELARRTGLNVVMGTGHYIARAHPAETRGRSAGELRDELVRELLLGVEPEGSDNPVRAGIIGEIGTSDPLLPSEERMLQAAAEAQQETGVGLVVHLDPWGTNGHAVLDRCEKAGADLDRLALAHMDPSLAGLSRDPARIEQMRELAARGVFVSIDIWADENDYGGRGMPTDDERILAVLRAHEEGWSDRLILAHDVCLKSQLRAFGGGGYDHLLVTIAPKLRAVGLGEAEIDRLFIDNPRRLLAGD